MSSGIRPNEYWDMSLSEISRYITAQRQFADNERKYSDRMACIIAYKTAELTALGVNNPKNFPNSAKSAFPSVFGGDTAASGGVPVSDWQRSKEQMQEYQRVLRGKGCGE